MTDTPDIQALVRAEVSRQLWGTIRPPETAPDLMRIMEVVARHYGVPLPHMYGQRGGRRLERPRHVFRYLALEMTGHSKKAIGNVTGRHHTTILNSHRWTLDRMQGDPAFCAEVNELMDRCEDDTGPKQGPCRPCVAPDQMASGEAA